MNSTRQEKAYRHIRDQLAKGFWREGQMLSPTDVAKNIGISYTPVREAMIQLAAEGFLEQTPQKRIFVKSLDRKELKEILELRRALESGAAELASEKITTQQITELRDCFEAYRKQICNFKEHKWSIIDKKNLSTLRRLDIHFHRIIIVSAGNAKLGKMVSDLHLLTQIFRQQTFQIPDVTPKLVRRVCADHWRILNAIEAGDRMKAHRWMAHHLRWGQEYHLQRLDEEEELQAHLDEHLWT